MRKLLIITGCTATGKTSLAILLAKKFRGEIVSADSRHVYRGMDIGTGKDIPSRSELITKNIELKIKVKDFLVGYRLKRGIPVWLVDIVPPSYRFNLGEYVPLAHKVISEIWKRNKLPIVVGGTGLYIKSFLVSLHLITIPPNIKLRNKLDKLREEKLQDRLKKINYQKWLNMNDSDRQNPRRLIRAIEISEYKQESDVDFVPPDWFMVYLYTSTNLLIKKIDIRVQQRVKDGVVDEIKRLLKKGCNFNFTSFSATPYFLFKEYFNSNFETGELESIIKKWKTRELQIARHQITWFKKMIDEFPEEKIFQAEIHQKNNQRQVVDKISKWYTLNN